MSSPNLGSDDDGAHYAHIEPSHETTMSMSSNDVPVDAGEDTFITALEHARTPSPVDGQDDALPLERRTLEEELHDEDLAPSDVDDLPPGGTQTPDDLASPGMASPTESGSIPDDTPSLQGSLQGSQVSLPLRPGLGPRGSLPRTPSGALQPFERRFSSRFSPSPSPSPRAASPAFLTSHSRQSSLSSQLRASQPPEIADTLEAPWDVVRWTKLKKITAQAFSEVGKRNFGSPTCLQVTSIIAVGTTKGLVLIFDYHQTLKSIIGQGTKAIESGAVTALAIAADHTTIAAGHASGHIFTWELSRPARPFLHVPPLPRAGGEDGDAHVPGRAVLHVGFLGTRHTALVSADDGGMAFSHLATRGLGAVTRTVRTTRLLGRYPVPQSPEKPRQKPSSVLAFAPLPLGNVEQATDDMGLTALLTPYLLVIVSTTPIAQTQHKASRPKDISPHGAMSGCLAWFPAVRLKTAKNGKENSESKLVYCWSNILTVLDVEVRESESMSGKEKPPTLFFHPRSRWQCEEAIVAVQWLSRSVIGLLTISQQMVILEDPSLNVMESVDLLQKQIYHRDLFSRQLHPVIEQTDNEHSEMHGVVADAFYQSFRVYKGRIFMLGVNDVSIGVVSNWADRLTALLEHGDNVAAIQLARSYWTGESGGVTVGLPEDPQARHALVGEKLLELITASVRYTFFEAQEEQPLHSLVAECFDACVTMDELDFLFDQVYEPFKDAGKEDVFLETLETYIMDEEIISAPPPVVKDLVGLFVSRDQLTHLEELLCRLDPRTFDIDQITTLCKVHYLYDALIFVWNEALQDYLTPFIDLLTLIRDTKDTEVDQEDVAVESAMKTFPYLAFALTGRKYPQGDFLDEEEAERHKADLYRYLFADQYMPWPSPSSPPFKTRLHDSSEPAFPYLRLLLEYDSASFMSMLSEAFEDPFLNGAQDEDGSSPITNGSGVKITRQYIISILLDIMSESEFAPQQTIYLDMFIARNLPKYPQFMILSGSQLQKVLDRLCSFRSEDLAHDCQLSVEYLLSIYHPPVTASLVQQLRNAEFYRVLKSLYRTEHRYLDLIRTYFEDPQDKEGVFPDLAHCLRTELSSKQSMEINALLYEHAQDLAAINTPRIARTLARYAPDTLENFIEALQDSYSRFIFLRTLLEPSRLRDEDSSRADADNASDDMTSRFCEQYVQLMCLHDPRHVADYVSLLKSGNLHLDAVLPTMEANGVIDAAVLLLAQDGLARDAVDRLCKHMLTLQNAICSLIEAASSAPDPSNTEETAADLIAAVDKYARLGIWLCQGQTSLMSASRRPTRHRTNAAWEVQESDLDLDELLWLNLIDAIVSLSKSVAQETSDIPISEDLDIEKINNGLRNTVQSTFTALLASTSSSSKSSTPGTPNNAIGHTRRSKTVPTNQSFLQIFRAFLTRASNSYAPTLSDLRASLLDIFTAYAHESSVLSLAAQLLDADVFVDVADVHVVRQRGWRPKSQVCEGCKRRAWGVGVSAGEPRLSPHPNQSSLSLPLAPAAVGGGGGLGSNGATTQESLVPGEGVWNEFSLLQQERQTARRERQAGRRDAAVTENGDGAAGGVGARGKGKRPSVQIVQERGEAERDMRERMTLVVFACRHVWHRACLERDMARLSEVGSPGTGAGADAGAGAGLGLGIMGRDDEDDDGSRGFWCPMERRSLGVVVGHVG